MFQNIYVFVIKMKLKKFYLESINSTINQLPIITMNDIQAKILRLAPGDFVKSLRITETGGELEYYRICK